MDRLPNRAHGLGEELHRLVWRHIARFEVDAAVRR